MHGYDQEFLPVFFNGKRDPLSPEYNWKPHWGVDPLARVVQPDGPKPPAMLNLLADENHRQDPVFQPWCNLFVQNRCGYNHDVELWNRFGQRPIGA